MPTIGILWQHMFGKFWQQMCSFGNNKFIFGSKCQFCAKPLKPPQNHGKPWKIIENHVKPPKNHGKPWETMENHGKPWKTTQKPWETMENHGKP